MPNAENDAALEAMKTGLALVIQKAREQNVDGKLRCRPLSEALTNLETGYLWLNEVGEEGVLGF